MKWQNITTPPLSSIVAAGPPTQEERSGENEWGEEDAEKEGLAEEETPIHVTTEAGPATGNQEELEEKALGNVSTLYRAPCCTIHFVPW